MTILLIERHQVDPAHRSAYETDLVDLLGAMRAAPGFLWCDASASLTDPESVTVMSEWRTPADLEAFVGTPGYKDFMESCDLWLRESPVTRRFPSVS